MKRILLTGSNGFIGKNIKESYLAQEYEIFAPASFELNLLDEQNVDDYFKNKEFDVVFHAASKPAYKTAKDCSNIFVSNVKMFENLERHKNKFAKFINFSSGAVYNIKTDITAAKEDVILKKPEDEYGLSKYVINDKIQESDNFINLNIFGIFGKYEQWQIRFISNAICKALYDMPITLRQNRRFSYLFIEDLMPVLEFFVENNVKYKNYNIVPDEYVELLELAQTVKRISDKNVDIKISQEGFGLDYYGDNSRLKSEFDFKFAGIASSIQKLYTWYNENIESIDKNLLLRDL